MRMRAAAELGLIATLVLSAPAPAHDQVVKPAQQIARQNSGSACMDNRKLFQHAAYLPNAAAETGRCGHLSRTIRC